ncbi:MAG TPA: PTS mannitol transporter subunit IICB [Euzebyales bacterium]|nr:PTS mannitol transporter subunit IICB [Euzebyales bacterium]
MSTPDVAPSPSASGGWRARIQHFGGNLAAMIMPNIGAFIAWGLITALFIEVGWLPNPALADGLVGPMITYLLPLLIAYTGGSLVHERRGGVIGAIAVMGVIAGSAVPQFLGAMAMGPLAAYVLKLFDRWAEPRIRMGFEMLVNNFSQGILGLLLAVVGFYTIGPIVGSLTEAARVAVDVLVANRLLPLASVIVEPAKILFLNNAINHGIFTPLGADQAAEAGKSILFMIETNPGPGLGILLAYWFAGPRDIRSSIPGAAVIHFFGGIHEIYFPYVLMKPQLVIAAILGGASGVMTAILTGTGLVASPAPGSIFAYIAVTPRGNFVGMFLAVLIAAAVSFVSAALILRVTAEKVTDIDEAREQSRAHKNVQARPQEA